MENEEYNESSRTDDFQKRMSAVAKLLWMCNNAPRDEEGNVVVDVVGLNKIGLFYIYHN